MTSGDYVLYGSLTHTGRGFSMTLVQEELENIIAALEVGTEAGEEGPGVRDFINTLKGMMPTEKRNAA